MFGLCARVCECLQTCVLYVCEPVCCARRAEMVDLRWCPDPYDPWLFASVSDDSTNPKLGGGSLQVCVAVCGCVWLCVWLCVFVCSRVREYGRVWPCA